MHSSVSHQYGYAMSSVQNDNDMLYSKQTICHFYPSAVYIDTSSLSMVVQVVKNTHPDFNKLEGEWPWILIVLFFTVECKTKKQQYQKSHNQKINKQNTLYSLYWAKYVIFINRKVYSALLQVALNLVNSSILYVALLGAFGFIYEKCSSICLKLVHEFKPNDPNPSIMSWYVCTYIWTYIHIKGQHIYKDRDITKWLSTYIIKFIIDIWILTYGCCKQLLFASTPMFTLYSRTKHIQITCDQVIISHGYWSGNK